MAEAVCAIDDFPADDLLWRIEWIGEVGYNTNVPSDPLIDVCLAQLPVGGTNPLSATSTRLAQALFWEEYNQAFLKYVKLEPDRSRGRRLTKWTPNDARITGP